MEEKGRFDHATDTAGRRRAEHWQRTPANAQQPGDVGGLSGWGPIAALASRGWWSGKKRGRRAVVPEGAAVALGAKGTD